MADDSHNFLLGLIADEAHVYSVTEAERQAVKEIAKRVDEDCTNLGTDSMRLHRNRLYYLALKFTGEKAAAEFRSRFLDWCIDRERCAIVYPVEVTWDVIQRQAAGMARMN